MKHDAPVARVKLDEEGFAENKLEVAYNYARNAYLKDVESRLLVDVSKLGDGMNEGMKEMNNRELK